jgi:hypothetical protein
MSRFATLFVERIACRCPVLPAPVAGYRTERDPRFHLPGGRVHRTIGLLPVVSFVVLLLGTAMSSGAQPGTWAHKDLWKPAKTPRPCEKERRNPRNLRCLFDASQFPTSTIEVAVKPEVDDEVTFTYDEWHSGCGTPGGKVVSGTFTVSRGASLYLDVLDAGRGISCREGFIVDCKTRAGRLERGCSDLLQVSAIEWKGNLQ